MTLLHVAFLRGIGPARKAPGDRLRAAFGAAGYEPVEPVLSTGNVIFGVVAGRNAPRPAALEAMLEAHFGYPMPVILRTGRQVAAMVASEPFEEVDTGRATRFVSMLGDDVAVPRRLPDPPAGAGFRSVGRTGRNLFLVRDNAGGGTPQMMAFVDKAFGRSVTTRNWNTMERIARLLDRMP